MLMPVTSFILLAISFGSFFLYFIVRNARQEKRINELEERLYQIYDLPQVEGLGSEARAFINQYKKYFLQNDDPLEKDIKKISLGEFPWLATNTGVTRKPTELSEKPIEFERRCLHRCLYCVRQALQGNKHFTHFLKIYLEDPKGLRELTLFMKKYASL